MYLREVHAEHSIPNLRQLIRDYSLGVVTTAIRSSSYPLIQCTHVPFILDVQDESSQTELGVLRGHIARANPHSKAMIESLESKPDGPMKNVLDEEVMVLFTSTTQSYLTPKFYTETKPATGKVVPTWNYAAAQVYGRARIYFDPHSEETGLYLSKQTDDLSRECEMQIMGHTGLDGRPSPWKLGDAPQKYVQWKQRGIMGIEITIERLEGKFKMSQELPDGDRRGVVEGFQGLQSEVGMKMADLVKCRAEMKLLDSRV